MYKPKPVYKPRPAYKPKPAYKPRPQYKPRPKPQYKPPSYKPKPSYRPKPKPKPKPVPTYVEETEEEEYGSPEAPASSYTQPAEAEEANEEYGSPQAPASSYSPPAEAEEADEEYGSPQAPASAYDSPKQEQQPTYEPETYDPESFQEVKPSDFPIAEVEEPSYTPSMVTTYKPPAGLFDMQAFGFPDFPMPMFPDLTPSFDEAAFESFKGMNNYHIFSLETNLHQLHV